MNIDPRHLEQLAAILDHGTLQEAAKHLGTSQPALSRMLANLEARLGVALFERNSRPLVPTQIGIKISDQGRAIKAARLRAAEDVRQGARGMSGELKIGAPPFMCERLVSDAISAFFHQRQDIHIQLTPNYFPQLERSILLNQTDVVICPVKLVESTKAELLVESLFQDEHVVVGRIGHALATKSDISSQDLQAATWIGHSKRSMLRSDMATALASIGVTNLNFAFQSESSGATIEMLRSSDFLTVLPNYAIGKTLVKSGLCILPLRFPTAKLTVGMVTLKAQQESPLLAAFKVHIREYVYASM